MASRESGHAHIRISPDTRRFAEELRAELRKVNVDHDVTVRPDTSQFDKELRAELAAMRHEAEVTVTADTTRYDAEMDAATAPGRYDATIDVSADTALAAEEIEWAARDRHTTIHTRVEGGAARSLTAISQRLNNITAATGRAQTALLGLVDNGTDALGEVAESAATVQARMASIGGNARNAMSAISTGATGAARGMAPLSRAINDADGGARRMTNSVGRAGGSLRRMGMTVGLVSTVVVGLGTALAGLVPVTFSAAAAIGQFVISTGAIVGAGAIPAVVGLGLAFGALKMATSGMGAAISGESEEAAEALAELPPEAQAAAKAMRDLRDEFVGFADVIKSDFWGSLNNIGELESLIVPAKNAMSDIAEETGMAGRSMVSFLTTGQGLVATEDLLRGAGDATGNLARALGNVTGGLVAIGGAMAPIFADMTAGAAGSMRAWSQNLLIMHQTGELQERLQGHLDNMRAGWDTFTGAMSTIGGIFSGVWSAVEGSGNAAYDAVARAFNATDEWVNSVQGQSALGDFFADAQTVAVGLLQTIGELSGLVAGTLAPAMADLMMGVGPGARDVLAGLEEGLGAIAPHVGPAASAFGDLLSAVAPALPIIGELGGAFLQVFAPAVQGAATALGVLSPLLDGVASLLGALPSPLVGIAAAWLAWKVLPAGVLAPITKATGGVTTAVGKAKGAVSGFGEAMGLQSTLARGLGKELTTTQAAMAALQTNVPAIGRMSEAFRQASHNGRTLGQVAVVAGQSVGGLRGNMLVAQGAALRFGATLKGVAAAGMSGVSSAARGLMGALGGPWGAAMLGASLAIGAVVSAAGEAGAAQDRLAEAASNARAAQEQLTMAAAGTTGALGEAGLAAAADLAAARLESMRVHSEMGVLSLSRAWKAWDDVLSGTGKNLAGVGIESNNAARAGKALENAMQETGMSVEDVNRAVAEGGSGYTDLIRSLEGMGTAGALAIIELAGTRGEIQATAEAAQRLPDNFAEVSAALDTIRDSASSAEDRLAALKTLVDELNGNDMSRQEALMAAAATIDEIANSASRAVDPTAELGSALFDPGTGLLNSDNANARALHGDLRELGDELMRMAESGTPAAEAFAKMSPALEKLQSDFQLTDAEMESLFQQYSLTPEVIQTVLDLQGVEGVKGDLADVWVHIHDLEKNGSVEVPVDAITDDARAALDEIGFAIEKTPDGKNFEITAETETASSNLTTFMASAQELTSGDLTVEAWLDTTPMQFSKTEADQLLNSLDTTDVSPEADLIIQRLLDGKDVSMWELALLAGETADPSAILENSDLLNKKVQSSGELSNLHNQVTDPKVTANNDDARTKLQAVIDKLKQIVSKSITVTANFVTLGAVGAVQSAMRRATGGLWEGPAYATGGRHRLPAYAGGQRHLGYRLPTTGPGTHETDGFLAFDSVGMPAAWLDAGEWIINGQSSKKYHNELRAINNGTFPKLPGYATGGQAGASGGYDDENLMTGPNVLRWVNGETMFGVTPPGGRSLEGSTYVWGGGSADNWGDCSGAMSLIAGLIAGKWFDSPLTRLFATGSQELALQSLGWTMGAAPRTDGVFELGWVNGGPAGGHTSGTLDGTNVEMGGGRGNGQVGGGAAGADHAQYTNRAWIELPDSNDAADDVLDRYDEDGNRRDPEDYVYGTDSTTGTSSARGAKAKDDRDPTKADTWSDAAGDVAHTAVSGQFEDAFNVLGIPDELPPALQAAKKAREFEEERRNPGSTSGTKSGTKSSGKQSDLEKDREKAADLDQKIGYAEDELAIAKTRRDETNNKTDSKGNKTATDSQKQQADLQVKKAEDKLADLKAERAAIGDVGEPGASVAGDDRKAEEEVAYRPGGGAEQWRPVIAQALRRMGLSESLAGITVQQIDIESGGDPNARNGWDINAQRGDPSIGLLQVIRSTFTAMRRQFPEANNGLPDDQAHPLANIVAALGWTVHKYGGPDNIWPTRNGYATGGRVWGPGGPKEDKIPAMLSDGEFVVNSEATSRNLPILERINSGGGLPAAARAQGDLSPGVTNFRVAPNMRRHFATGGLAALDATKLIAEAASKAGGAGIAVLNGAMSGVMGGAAPSGDGSVEGEVIRRMAGAAQATTGHLTNFAREVGGSLLGDFVGSAYVGGQGGAFADMLTADAGHAVSAANMRAASQPIVVATGGGDTKQTTFNLHGRDTHEQFNAARLKDWQDKALTHAGGRN